MKKPRKTTLMLVTLLISFITFPVEGIDIKEAPYQENTSRSERSMTFGPPAQYIPHDPIFITNDDGFSAAGFPGDGTKENPYRIAGLNITSFTPDGLIYIENTQVYFQIKDNFIQGIGEIPNAGISLVNVRHGIIDTNIVTQCRRGISLAKSRDTTLSHNTLTNNRGNGIYLKQSSNITLSHNIVSHSRNGIYLGDSGWNILTHNVVTENMYGIYLAGLGRNTLSYNTVSNSQEAGIFLIESGQNRLLGNRLLNNGLIIHSRFFFNYFQANVTSNVVNDKPLIYWQNVMGGTVPLGAGQILLVNTTGVEVTSQELSRASIGLFAAFSSNLYIHDNIVSNNTGGVGIHLFHSKNTTLTGNTVSNHGWAGIHLDGSEHNTLASNTLVHNVGPGIRLDGSGNNLLDHNSLVHNRWGIYIAWTSENNTLASNTLTNNSRAGISLSAGTNTVIGNNLVNNGLTITGFSDSSDLNLDVRDNVVNGRSLVYWQDSNGGLIPPGAGQIILINTTGVEVVGQNLSRTSVGLFAAFCSNLSIHHNSFSNNTGEKGIYLYHSENITLSYNILINNTLGISLVDSGQNILSHNTIVQNVYGISIGDSGQNILSYNSLTNNTWGIFLRGSRQNTLLGNRLVNNGLAISGVQLEDYIQTNVSANEVNGKPLIYWQNVVGGTVPPGAGQILLVNTTGVEVTGQDLSRASIGLFTAFSSNLDIHHNTVSNSCWAGIALVSSRDTTLFYNTVLNNHFESYIGARVYLEIVFDRVYGRPTPLFGPLNNTWAGIVLVDATDSILAHNTVAHNQLMGITLVGSRGIIISSNTLSNNSWAGIRLEWSGENTITNNTVLNSEYGIITQWECKNNTLSHNTVSNNTRTGIYLGYSDKTDNNTVQWNNFLGNNQGGGSQAWDHGTNNVIANNYWYDHNNTDLNADGIADTPYVLEGRTNNQDPSPLVTTVAETSTRSKIPGFEWFLVLGGIPLLRRRRRRTHRR